MARTSFELVFDYSDGRTQVIKHSDMGLYIKVLPERLNKRKYASDEIALVATFFSRGMCGRPLKEHVTQTHFLVLKGDYEKRVLWDEALLQEAIQYFCEAHLGRRYDELHLVIQGQRLPLEAESYG